MAEPSVPTTLDEPIYTTIWRDVRAILLKTFHVVIPFIPQSKGASVTRDWDLWGPLLYCFTLALVLSLRADKTVGSSSGELSDQGALLFSAVFVIVWLGATVITINALLLGGKISFFQSCCVFGYCIFPIMVASLITWAWANIYFRLLVCVLAVVWSAAASVGFMANLVPPHRKILAVYPVLLFYSVLGWMVLIQA